MRTVALIQARMGSTRLPGKVMLSLDCTPVIRHVVRRAAAADVVDTVAVATTDNRRDDIVERYASREGADVFRGDTTDVLGRMYGAGNAFDADTVIRLTADNPLCAPAVIDTAVKKLQSGGLDYVSNKIDRTFPSGLDVEVFTFDSFSIVEREADDSYDREHVTPPYRERDEYDVANLRSTEVFEDEQLQNRTDLRLTLDRPDDFELFSRIYDTLPFDDIVDVGDAVRYVDDNDLAEINHQ